MHLNPCFSENCSEAETQVLVVLKVNKYMQPKLLQKLTSDRLLTKVTKTNKVEDNISKYSTKLNPLGTTRIKIPTSKTYFNLCTIKLFESLISKLQAYKIKKPLKTFQCFDVKV